MMRGFTSPLWPIRYKPFPDELLSCWIVRLAHGHGLKVQTFCNQIFGNQRQVWNRDIDRLAPAWLVEELSYRTGTSAGAAWGTTLKAYEGVLYRKFLPTGTLQWVLSLKMYHRKRKGFGLQFCPKCLAGDSIPYFRKCWRVALMTVCPVHDNQLLDRCPNCGTAIALHRIDMMTAYDFEAGALSYCHACGFDIRDSPNSGPAISYDRETSKFLNGVNLGLYQGGGLSENGDVEHLEVLRQLCGLLTSRYKHAHLREFVLDQIGADEIPLADGRFPFESRTAGERHHIAQLAAWILVGLQPRLEAAWRSGAVRFNLLLKDFENPPEWYCSVIGKFSNWRYRKYADDCR